MALTGKVDWKYDSKAKDCISVHTYQYFRYSNFNNLDLFVLQK